MSVDPSSPPPPEPEEPRAETPKFPKQKRRHRKPEDADDDLAEEDEDEAAALLTSVLKRLLRRKKTDEDARSPRQAVNRFLPRAESASPAGEDGPPEAGTLATATLPKFRPRVADESARIVERREVLWHRGLLYSALALVLFPAAFLAGRFTAPPSAVTASQAFQTAPVPLGQSAFSEPLEKALAADHAGDPATAAQLVDALPKNVRLSLALQIYRATLETRLGHTDQAETSLSRLLGPHTPPEAASMINTARAFNYARRREFDHALPCYAAVAQAAPFDVANLLHWGEVLRRRGDLTDAADMLQEALDRLPATAAPYVDAQRQFIAYVRRLSQIENGRAADLKPELDARLSEPTPSGYWLMTAAAIALQKGDVPSAVDALTRARATFPAAQFNALIGDYFFRSFAYHPEMNTFAVAPAPNQPQTRRASMDYFLDP